jgi:hypothetical protein
LAVIFIPSGVYTLIVSFAVTDPHVFVLFVFSGSLMVMLGLAGLIGIFVNGRDKRKKLKENEDSFT